MVEGENPIQAIITSYRFKCCGVITEWRASIELSSDERANTCTITFQVWRPDTTSLVDTYSCYNKVGWNDFSFNPLLNHGSADEGIVKMTVPENERIEVQPGDVVGLHLESCEGKIRYGTNLNLSEEVWYVTGPTASGSLSNCSLSVGPNHTLSSFTSHAPLITATVCE